MKCEKCGKEFPHKKGRFCGTCHWNTPGFKTGKVAIDKQVLFSLMYSHSRLAQAEYCRNPAYNDSHYSHMAETAIANDLLANIVDEYFDYVDAQERSR